MSTEDSKDSKDEYVAKVEGELDGLDKEVDGLKEKMQDAQGEAKAEYEDFLATLTQKRQELEDRLNEVVAAGEDKWEELKGQAEHAWKAFQNSVKYFKSHFK
jgi:chromosome segregation ATPase